MTEAGMQDDNENVDNSNEEAEVVIRWAQEHRPFLGWLGVARLGPLDAVMSVRATVDDPACFEGYLSLSFADTGVGFRGLDEEALGGRLEAYARRWLAWEADQAERPGIQVPGPRR